MANAAPIEQLARNLEGQYFTNKPILDVGAEIDNRFLVRNEIGKGGQAVVYGAFDDVTEQEVALKIPVLESEDSLGRAVREAVVTKVLSEKTEDVVPFVASGVSENDYKHPLLYLATKQMPNDTLGSQIAKHNRRKEAMPIDAVLRAVLPACRALKVMHEEEHLVHRDIKIGNVLIDEHGNGRLADFGIVAAERFEPEFFEDQHISPDVVLGSLTATESLVGVLQNMPPEVIFSEQGFTEESDTFLTGVMLHHTLTGSSHMPRTSNTPTMHRYNMEHYAPPIAADFGGHVPRDLAQLAIACLDRQPQHRPTMSEVVVKLEDEALQVEASANLVAA